MTTTLPLPGAALVKDRRQTIVCLGAAAVSTDLALRTGGPGLALALSCVVVAGGVITHVDGRERRALAMAAAIFGSLLALRSSPSILLLDLVAWTGLLTLAVSGPGSANMAVEDLVRRACRLLAHQLTAPAFIARLLPSPPSRNAGAIARGLFVAAPLAVVLALLLGSADAVFASFLPRLPSMGDLPFHAVGLGIGAWGMAGLLSSAGSSDSATPRGAIGHFRPGAVESITVLASLVLVYGGFAIAQVVALFEGGRRVLETSGLTYAEYARSGFFQLLVAAAITVAVLVFVQPAADQATHAHRRWLLVLGEAAVALTLVAVVVSVRRLALYEHAYGLTMLRLMSTATAWWIGLLLALLGAAAGGARRDRDWFVPAALASGLLLLLGLNLVNPEAIVVRHNVSHAERTGTFDMTYAQGLSDDAVPTLLAALPRLRDAVPGGASLTDPCQSDDRPRSWVAWSWSHHRAERARRTVCESP